MSLTPGYCKGFVVTRKKERLKGIPEIALGDGVAAVHWISRTASYTVSFGQVDFKRRNDVVMRLSSMCKGIVRNTNLFETVTSPANLVKLKPIEINILGETGK